MIMIFLNLDGVTSMYKWVVAEHPEGYYCAVFVDGNLLAEAEFKTRGQTVAWFKLVIGAYPDVYLNDEVA
jgi:hypothetical protein